MTQTRIHGVFAPFKRFAPTFLTRLMRRSGTALLTPVFFSIRSGHFRSSCIERAVSSSGRPLPWYTYPCIDFLKVRSFSHCKVLEFGGGQSTLWWAERASSVFTLEGDEHWCAALKSQCPENTQVFSVSMDSATHCIESVERQLANIQPKHFDVIVIDGLYRCEMIAIALRLVSEQGIIICDNSEGYGFFETFRDKKMMRVDFFGYAPGVVLPHCTSIYFSERSTLFSAHVPIPTIATWKSDSC